MSTVLPCLYKDFKLYALSGAVQIINLITTL